MKEVCDVLQSFRETIKMFVAFQESLPSFAVESLGTTMSMTFLIVDDECTVFMTKK
jgi:hypothetical protein